MPRDASQTNPHFDGTRVPAFCRRRAAESDRPRIRRCRCALHRAVDERRKAAEPRQAARARDISPAPPAASGADGAGEMSLARAAWRGTFRPLRPTLPAQTPVSWSTFSTGIDPGRTGIFDFLPRNQKNCLPVFAAFDETKEPFAFGEKNPMIFGAIAFGVLAIIALLIMMRWRVAGVTLLAIAVAAGAGVFYATQKLIPTTRPGVVNRRQGIPFWEVAARAGKKTMVVHVPVTFPANDFGEEQHLLSGLGVPDMSGRVGKPFYFTSELDFHRSGSNEFSIEVVQLEDNKGSINTKIQGPPNKLFGNPPYISIPMTLTVAGERNSAQIGASGQKFARTG